MHAISVNLPAMGAAAAFKFLSGALWYSPMGFARPWQRLTGVSDPAMASCLRTALPLDVVGCLAMSFVLGHVVSCAGAASFAEGAAVGCLAWLGFVAVATLSANRWEGRPLRLFLLTNGQHLLSMAVMGGILAAWR